MCAKMEANPAERRDNRRAGLLLAPSQRISRATKETAAGLTRRMRNDAANDLLKHCRQWSQDKLPVRWAG